MALADQICLSQTPPIWLAAGGFLSQIIQSAARDSKSNLTCWSTSFNAWPSSLAAPTKLLPLSDLMNLTFPLQAMNLHNASMNELVSIKFPTSIWIALLLRQVNNIPYLLISDHLSLMMKGPNMSTPQYVNGGASVILSIRRLAIFYVPNFPQSLWQVDTVIYDASAYCISMDYPESWSS